MPKSSFISLYSFGTIYNARCRYDFSHDAAANRGITSGDLRDYSFETAAHYGKPGDILLLTVPDPSLANWKAADFSDDNKLSAADLTRMKRKWMK